MSRDISRMKLKVLTNLAIFCTRRELVRIITAKALGIICRANVNMAISRKPPAEGTLKVILTEEDTSGASRT